MRAPLSKATAPPVKIGRMTSVASKVVLRGALPDMVKKAPTQESNKLDSLVRGQATKIQRAGCFALDLLSNFFAYLIGLQRGPTASEVRTLGMYLGDLSALNVGRVSRPI
jgi:hypothetical protein